MVAKFFICEGKVSNVIHYFIYVIFLLIFLTKVDNTKCKKLDQLQPDGCYLFVLLISICVKEKSNFSCVDI